MRNQQYKGKVVKIKLSKCDEVIRCYDRVMLAYAQKLEEEKMVKRFRCNVPISDELTTDFWIERADSTVCVRECVLRSVLTCKVRNKIVERLDYSRCLWSAVKGIDDWGIVVDEEE